MGALTWAIIGIIVLILIVALVYELSRYQQAKDNQPPGIELPFGLGSITW